MSLELERMMCQGMMKLATGLLAVGAIQGVLRAVRCVPRAVAR